MRWEMKEKRKMCKKEDKQDTTQTKKRNIFSTLILSAHQSLLTLFMVIETFSLLCTAIDYLVTKWTKCNQGCLKDKQMKEENWTGPLR